MDFASSVCVMNHVNYMNGYRPIEDRILNGA